MTSSLLRQSLLTIAILTVAACDSPTEPSTPGTPVLPAMTGFMFEQADNPALRADAVGVMDGDTVRVVLPNVAAVTSLKATFSLADSGTTVRIGAATQSSGVTAADFTHDVTYRLESRTGHLKAMVVKVTVFTGLPVVTVTTEGGAPILNREDYVNATLNIFGGKDRPEHNFEATTQIRGRGNSTWSNPKKPYRLKLTTSASVFGFPADRDWTLLANYWDQSLTRNALAFEVSRLLDRAYTPRCTPVELVLNGAHQGSYQLCEHMEAAAHRIPAPGGWLLEIDDLPRVDPSDQYFRSPRLDAWSLESDPNPSVWVFKQPSAPTLAQRADVERDILEVERVLYGEGFAHPDTGYAKLLDVEALISWYLTNELLKNNDAAFFKSVYMYRVPGGRITLGPVWDFDLAVGNYPFDGGPTGWKIRNSTWIERLFEDRVFIDRLKVRWQGLYARRAEIDQYIVSYTNALQLSQRLTHPMWAPYAPLPLLMAESFATNELFPSRLRPASAAWTDADYATEVSELRTWLNTRWAWLHTSIMDL
jgi:hypothetical protein